MTAIQGAAAQPQQDPRIPARHLRSNALLVVLGCVVLFAGLLPAMLVPMQNDDLVVILSNNADAESLTGIVRIWFQGLEAAGRTTFASAVGAAVTHYSIWRGSSLLGLPVPYVERMVASVWILLAVSSAAWFCTVVWSSRSPFRRNSAFAVAFFLTAVVLAVTAQIHSRWSNDPLVSYPPWGFGSAAVGFAYLALLFRGLRPERGAKAMIALAAGGALVAFWYEMLWPLFGVALVVVMVDLLAVPERARRVRRSFAIAGSGVMIPVLALVLVRSTLTPDGSTYSGTQLALDDKGLLAFSRGLLGTLPGAGWPLSANSTIENATLGLDWRPVLGTTVIVVATIVAVAVLTQVRPERGEHGFRLSVTNRTWWLPIVAVLMFWAGSVATIAFTEKYSTELYRLGTVYSFYVPGALSLAVVIVGLVFAGHRLTLPRPWTSVVLVGVISFALVQSWLNWSLLDLQRHDMSPASRLMALVNDPAASVAQRCAASRDFTSATYPFYAYPNDEVLRALDKIHRRDTGTPWCRAEEVAG